METMLQKPARFFHPHGLLDDFFEISILLKFLDGLLETLSGLALLLIRPETLVHWVQWLTHSELTEDPHDFIASHLVHWAASYTKQTAVFAAIYLLSHGLVKVILVYEVLRGRLWAYLWLIVVTAAFVVYQVAHFIHRPSVGFALLTGFDFVIIYLTGREYAKQKRLQASHVSEE